MLVTVNLCLIYKLNFIVGTDAWEKTSLYRFGSSCRHPHGVVEPGGGGGTSVCSPVMTVSWQCTGQLASQLARVP